MNYNKFKMNNNFHRTSPPVTGAKYGSGAKLVANGLAIKFDGISDVFG